MKKFNLAILSFILLLATACEEDRAFPEYGDMEHGAFARTLSKEGAFFLTDVDNSSIDISVEFYDDNDGRNVASYAWTVEYLDRANDGANDAGPIDILTINASQFSTNPDTGLPSTSFSFALQGILDAFGFTIDDVEVGNTFRFEGTITLNDGRTFSSGNTGVNVVASAPFSGLFSFDADLVCPSDLAGDYTAMATGTSTDGCCPDETTVTTDVTLTAKGAGVYEIDDWSGGLYFEWYEIYGITADYVAGGGLTEEIKDICDVISGNFTEPFGTETVIEGSVDRSTGVITYTWINGYDDQATVTLTPK